MANPKQSFGLKSGEGGELIEALRKQYGVNDFTPPPSHPAWMMYLLQYTDPFMLMLIVAGILSFIAYSLDTTQPINLCTAGGLRVPGCG